MVSLLCCKKQNKEQQSLTLLFEKRKENRTMKKIIYTLKQLLPLTYYSKYRVQNGAKELAIWTQWFGKPFNIKRFTLTN